MSEKEKLDELRICCAMLGHFPQEAQYLEKAAALARELFPPSAKVLVWVGLDAQPYRISRYFGVWRALQWQYQVDDDKWFLTFLPDSCISRDEAVAACEARHQERFLEQMA